MMSALPAAVLRGEGDAHERRFTPLDLTFRYFGFDCACSLFCKFEHFGDKFTALRDAF